MHQIKRLFQSTVYVKFDIKTRIVIKDVQECLPKHNLFFTLGRRACRTCWNGSHAANFKQIHPHMTNTFNWTSQFN